MNRFVVIEFEDLLYYTLILIKSCIDLEMATSRTGWYITEALRKGLGDIQRQR